MTINEFHFTAGDFLTQLANNTNISPTTDIALDYTLYIRQYVCYWSYCGAGLGSFANCCLGHSTATLNAVFCFDVKLFLKASKNISQGEEIFVSYGAKY
jgi:hypothetical protein